MQLNIPIRFSIILRIFQGASRNEDYITIFYNIMRNQLLDKAGISVPFGLFFCLRGIIGYPDGYRRTLSRSGFKGNPGLIVIIELQPVDYILQPITSRILSVVMDFIIGHQTIYGTLVHADAVIIDDNPYHAVIEFYRQGDDSVLLIGIGNAVKNAVFDDRLEQELHDPVVFQFLVDLRRQLDILREPQILQLNIQPDMLHFVGDGNIIAAIAQTDPVKPGQFDDNIADLFHIVSLGRPGNEIQGVVQKMGIDLSLQYLQLHGVQILAKLVLILHQGVDLFHHVVETGLKISDLVRAVHNTVYIKIAAFHNSYLLGQGIDSFGILSSVEIR